MEPHYPLFYTFHFYLFGVIALASALAFVTRKSPVAAALWLVNTMFSLSTGMMRTSITTQTSFAAMPRVGGP